jgi:acyl-[acyl-carrier-protein]-phospholipid O-acyltransferase / long-chain-fatty-acid--[acyl-carrier-protein] ligase
MATSGGYSEVLKNRGFVFLLAAQALAVFDDNTFKQLVMLFVVASISSLATRNLYISLGTALYVLPYIVFSCYAGQVADHFSKRRVIIFMKVVEASLLVVATFAMFAGHVIAMLAVLFLLGIHACFLDPAKEGILPQIFPDEALSRANGLMQLTVYTMIVSGPVAGGLLLDAFASKPYVPVAMLVGTALMGLAMATGISRVPATAAGEKIHWNAFGEFRHDFAEIRTSRPLYRTVLAIAYFWFLGAVYLQNVIGYGRDLLNLSNTGISYLTASVSIGIGLGAFLAGKLSGERVELGLVPIGSIGLGVFGAFLFFAHHSIPQVFIGHFFLGFSGGIFIIPLQSYLQANADERSKGRIIATSNVLTFTGVFLGAGIFALLSGPCRMQPNQILLVMAAISFGATWHILTVLPDFMIRLCFFLLTHTFYRIEVRGAENLPRRGPALLVCNHISFADPFLIGACTSRFIRFLMFRRFFETPGIHWLVKSMGAIPIAAGDKPGELAESLRGAQDRLRDGDLVCIFAEGAITRTGNLLRFRRGFERIMRGLTVPIIPVHLDRVWGSIFSFERGRFFFKWPRRIPYRVTVSFGAPLPGDADAFQVRQAVMALSADAFARRGASQHPLPELFLDSARRNWRRFAMADSMGREVNFGQVLIGALLFRRHVLKACGVEKAIGVLLPPSVPGAMLNYGISLAGRVPVNLNYTASKQAMEIAIERSDIKTIFTTEKLLSRLGIEEPPGMVLIEEVAKNFTKWDKLRWAVIARLVPTAVLRRALIPRNVKLDSLATVIFSSGSTGTPKGVMLSHRNIVSNLEGVQQTINVNRQDCLLGILPFFHSFGFSIGLWLPAISGFGVAFHSNPLEARKIGELCKKYHVTLMISTPTFVWDYVRRCEAEDFASLRVAIVGAEKMKPELADAFREKFHLDLLQGYGCTELSPVVSVETSGYAGRDGKQVGAKRGTVGHPIPGVAVRIVNPETFATLGCGQEGMLLVKGPSVMAGYLGEPEKTRQVMWEDGWYITGDVARLDEDGFIQITDRLSRFSKVGGEMVSHVQVEEALHRALGSFEPRMVVTSVSDEQKGERFVVLHTELGLSVDELLKRMRDSGLPKLWVPRKENFFQVPALPYLGSGKLDLKQVKETAVRLASANAVATPESESV